MSKDIRKYIDLCENNNGYNPASLLDEWYEKWGITTELKNEMEEVLYYKVGYNSIEQFVSNMLGPNVKKPGFQPNKSHAEDFLINLWNAAEIRNHYVGKIVIPEIEKDYQRFVSNYDVESKELIIAYVEKHAFERIGGLWNFFIISYLRGIESIRAGSANQLPMDDAATDQASKWDVGIEKDPTFPIVGQYVEQVYIAGYKITKLFFGEYQPENSGHNSAYQDFVGMIIKQARHDRQHGDRLL